MPKISVLVLALVAILSVAAYAPGQSGLAIPGEASGLRAPAAASAPGGTRHERAAAWRGLRYRDEQGTVAPEAFAQALQQRRALAAASAQRGAAGAGVTRASWTPLGPGNVGGSARALAFPVAADAQSMLLASVGGGVWRTADGGLTWEPTDDQMGSLYVTAMASGSANPSVVFIGTGGGLGGSFNETFGGAGAFKSTDGGRTWALLPSTNNQFFLRGVIRMAVSADGATVLATTRPFSNAGALWRSADGGTTWAEVSGANGVQWTDVAFHPANPLLAMAGSSTGNLRRSTDGGRTWQDATGIPTSKRIAMAFAASDQNVVYASVDENNGDIYRSADAGRTFARVNTGGQFLGQQGWYCNVLWIDPTNPNVLIVGGTDLFRSTDGGTTFAKISTWQEASRAAETGAAAPTPHADHHAIVSHPGFNGTTNKTVYFLNDGGIWQTRDVYAVAEVTGWESLNNNLAITQFYGVAGNPTTGVLVGGTQDNGTVRYGGDSQRWTAMKGGDGGFNAADPTDTTVFYGEYVNLTIGRSNDAGMRAQDIYGKYNSWNGTSWEQLQIASPIAEATNEGSNFIAPFILDPNEPNRMLAGGRSLWRTNDVKTPVQGTSGPTWTAIKDPANANVSAIAVAPGKPDVIWVGHNDGAIFKTTNGTAAQPTWARVDVGAPLPSRFVTRVVLDAGGNTVYAMYGGFTADNLWRSTDAGATWSRATGAGASALPSAPVNTLAINPDDAKLLYAGTEVGIFTSEDAGQTWGVPQDGPATVAVYELVWLNKTLYAATFGRGVWRADPTPRSVAASAPVAAATACYTVAITVQPAATAGTVAVSPAPNCTTAAGSAGYSNGTALDLTPRPAAGYTFGTWTGLKGIGRQTVARVRVMANLVVEADFASAPTNDDVRNARTIPTSGSRSALAAGGFVDVLNTESASSGAGDQVTCEGDKGQSSVWYTYTATRSGTLNIDTTGSSYNSVVSVYEGVPGSLTVDACSEDGFSNDGDNEDDTVNGKASVEVEAGKTYYIEVVGGDDPPEDPDEVLHGGRDTSAPGGGVLVVNATVGAPIYKIYIPISQQRAALRSR